ncbi:MAG: PKD domain-containing protein, partial [Myxococcota bacterium]
VDSSSLRRLNIWVQNNIIANSSVYALRDEASFSSARSTVRLDHNNYHNRNTVSNVQPSSNTGNITSDPLIEDDDWDSFPRWWDGKVWATSLAINAGKADATRLPDRDITGKPRNFGNGVDIGAWEFDVNANQEPRADPVATSIMVPRGEPFELDGSEAYDPDIDGNIAVAFWTMSDGTVTAGQTVTHTFAQEGNDRWAYLTVIDNEGAEDHVRVDINVNIRPIANAGPAVFQDAGPDETVFFDGTLSEDLDGSIVSWSWDFGDGSPVSTDASPTHSYLDPGQYTVTLTVTDNEGLTDTDTTLATVFGTQDTFGPVVTHSEIADGQPVAMPVVIRATIQDPSGVASALLQYRVIGSPVPGFAPMMALGNNLYEATIPADSVTAPGVEYWITANDEENNQSVTPRGAPTQEVWDFIVLGDPDPPAITHTEITDGQTPDTAISVTATVTDATGVEEVNLYFRSMSGNSFGAVSMANINGDTWAGQIPAFLVTPPGVEYYIEATDSSPIANTGTAPANAPSGGLFDFTVGSDDTAPIITHTPITSGQPAGSAVAITASITDNTGVASATLAYRVTGGGAYTQAPLMRIGGGTTWQGQIPAAAVTTAGVDYYITAQDDVGNEAFEPSTAPATPYRFTVNALDSTGPVYG